MNVYEEIPVLESKNFKLRGVIADDADDLLKVYSDVASVPYFNSDNCNGDDFQYTTLKRMKEAVDFWLWSYANGYFVRWSIIDKKIKTAIGTIELFHHDDKNEIYDNCGLLRLDLRSDYEKQHIIKEILSAIKPRVKDMFGDKIVTKVKSFATERIAAVSALGFTLPKVALKGHNGEEFNNYYVAKLI